MTSLLGVALFVAVVVALSLKRRLKRASAKAALANDFRELSLQLHAGYASLAFDVQTRRFDQQPATLPSGAELDALVRRFRALSARGGWLS